MVQHVAEPSEDVDDRQGVYTAAQSKGGPCQLPIHTQRKHQPTPANCAMRQQQRPATAHGGPAARPASRGAATAAGDSKHDRTPVNTVNKPVNYSALARLKAEIAELAAYQNIQLQSLKPLCSLDAAVLTGDSSAELPLQVITANTGWNISGNYLFLLATTFWPTSSVVAYAMRRFRFRTTQALCTV